MRKESKTTLEKQPQHMEYEGYKWNKKVALVIEGK